MFWPLACSVFHPRQESFVLLFRLPLRLLRRLLIFQSPVSCPDPCSIRVSSVAKNCPSEVASLDYRMSLKNMENVSRMALAAGCFQRPAASALRLTIGFQHEWRTAQVKIQESLIASNRSDQPGASIRPIVVRCTR